MGIYQDPRMVALRAAQSREKNAKLYDQFLRLHPELDGYIDRDDWTPAEDEAFREFAASVVHSTRKRDKPSLQSSAVSRRRCPNSSLLRQSRRPVSASR